MGIYTRSPIAIISLTKANIKAPKDLEGKKLGAPPTDAGYLLLPAFAQMTKLDVSKIQVEAIDLTLRESTLATGRVDAVTGFDSTTWFNLKRIGMKREISSSCISPITASISIRTACMSRANSSARTKARSPAPCAPC